jgi:hypothetical protein
MRVDLEPGRDVLLASVEAFVGAATSLSEHELLGSSRCHGWARLDVVSHVLGGWQELLGGLACATEAAPDVDAATYWTAYATDHDGVDPVDALMWQRRRTAAYRRPSLALAELRDVGEVLAAALAAPDGRARAFQGHVVGIGDLCATWAVENAVHHLDLLVEQSPPGSALRVARETVEAIAGPLPGHWSDVDAVLVGCGRMAVPPDAGDAAARLPALG